MKYIIKYFILAFCINFVFSYSCNNQSTHKKVFSQPDSLKLSDTVPAVLYDTIWIASVGDLMCHSQQFQEARTSDGYDFSYVYTAIKPYLSNAELCFGNLETVTAGNENRFTGYPAFNTPVEYLDALKFAGFDVITTANNHSLDRSFTGVERTIDALLDRGFYQTGTFKTEEESKKILIVTAKNISIAVLAFTYGTNGIRAPAGKEFCVNYINDKLMKEQIDKAKSLGADKIAVFIHWGTEYQRTPSSEQKRIADFLFSEGVDLIFGSHPHVIQPLEVRNDLGKKQFIIYSMGNFISNQRKKYTDSGVIIRVQLIKNRKSKEVIIGEINYIPTYVSTSGGFKILPVKDALQAIENNLTEKESYSPADYTRLKQVWQETTSHLTDSDNNIFPYEITD